MVKKRLAEQIIENVGSVSNISSIAHCMTRLRLKVKDESKVNTQVIPKLEGVMKFLKVGDQYQIVLGAIVDDVFDESKDLVIFDPQATWKKTHLKGGTYTMKELMVKVFDKGECIYQSPSVMEIREFCKKEQETLWDETRRLVNPHEVYVDLSDRLYAMKTKLLNEMHPGE